VRLIPALCLLVLVIGSARADVDPALREDGVLYYADNLPSRLIATVKTPTTVYLRRDFGMPLASLFAGQKIEIVGGAREGYLITCTYRNNSVTGWIMPSDLPPDVDQAHLAEARKNQARRNQMAAVIAAKQVIRGMTVDEVHQSLGNPDQTSSHTDASGTSQIWTFTTYQDVWQTSYAPGPYGRAVLQSYPVRTPVGQTIVTFTNGVVSAIEQHQTNPDSPAINPYPN
jgi:hypothetical protein